MIEYDSVRRFQHHSSFDLPNYHYNNRDSHISVSNDTRNSPRAYPVTNHARSRVGVERDELHGLTMENGPARRRIAVAVSFAFLNIQPYFALARRNSMSFANRIQCARCRKRKIRCSGDRGDGLGCNNCRQAGVDSSQCQFHRVRMNICIQYMC
jgi:hypothetical protein